MSADKEPKLVFYYAVADNGVVGKDNDMPWHISSDLKRFKAMTLGKPLVMGRKTYQSIGRPLPGRTNIVISADNGFDEAGIVKVASIEDALDTARSVAQRDGVDEIVIMGGGSVYNALWDRADKLQVTHIHCAPEGDTFMPAIDMNRWSLVSKDLQEQGANDSAAFSYACYERK
ncbi:dihydrofolate reductase [uncultured Cohaesibacter sp.]|uniref:dihydrofolate reductase n=1 Tax=uncultured Cohaesibacter sp. TaxID=1002546 RepID=UPI00292E75AA|nr:dihydrofolate reductase [uncultured Cohaesibacter sp.]